MEKRLYPRIDIRAQQQIFCLSPQNEFLKNVVISKNLSASGFCVRSDRPYPVGSFVLVYLDDTVLEDLAVNRAAIVKVGRFFMARVVWNSPSKSPADPFYDVGCAFLEKAERNSEKINLFVHLINRTVADRLSMSD